MMADFDDDRGASRRGTINCDRPPYSRLFIVCARHHTEEDLRRYFDRYGVIEDVWVVRDRGSKESRGVAYIKFAKASQATLAMEQMNGKALGSETKPIKVMMANSRSSGSSRDIDQSEELMRLFIIIPKTMTEDDIKQKFEEYGDVDYINIVRDRSTGDPKGFAYVKFHKASHAMLALERVDRAFKAVLAEPKIAKIAREKEKERERDMMNSHSNPYNSYNTPQIYGAPGPGPGPGPVSAPRPEFGSGMALPDLMSVSQKLQVTVDSTVSQEQLSRLFDLIPGMEYCNMNWDYSSGLVRGIAHVRFTTTASAMYAKEKLNGFEYPPGSRITVKYIDDDIGASKEGNSASGGSNSGLLGSGPHSGVSESGGSGSFSQVLVRHGYGDMGSPTCSVSLPAPQPLAPSDSEIVDRLFVVCNPQPPPSHILRDVFSRFGNLIDVYMLGSRNYGYAKYADKQSAQMAITALHGQEVGGMRLKVLAAEPPPSHHGDQDRDSDARKRQRTGP
ncbi:RNA-binding protein 45-like [Ptychodera flava]|uniref:RNA-binding protein 45-like n=1 Tax=Ptychodera flava TaxID=63121 RepID=UPI00396A69CA